MFCNVTWEVKRKLNQIKGKEKKNEIISLILDLKKNGINDLNVLRVIEMLPRNIFIEESIKSKANLNIALPIECGQTISQPLVVAFMTQALELNKKLRVLEIGTGSGYQTAVLSSLSRFVYTIERFRTLNTIAKEKLTKLGFRNIFFKHDDGGFGWESQAPFDRIIVTAAAPEIPNALIDQLTDNGILIIPIGEDNDTQFLIKIKKNNKNIKSQKLIPVRFVPLLEGKQP